MRYSAFNALWREMARIIVRTIKKKEKQEPKKVDLAGKVIAVDFDGTLAKSQYPSIGEPNHLLIAALKEAKKNGAKIILWTCRSGKELEEAVLWSRMQGLKFDAINDDLPEVKERFGDTSKKIFAHYYIDDRALRPGEVY